MVVIFGQNVEFSVSVAMCIIHTFITETLPWFVAVAVVGTAGVLDALGAVGALPAGVAEALIQVVGVIGAEAVFHIATYGRSKFESGKAETSF